MSIKKYVTGAAAYPLDFKSYIVRKNNICLTFSAPITRLTNIKHDELILQRGGNKGIAIGLQSIQLGHLSVRLTTEMHIDLLVHLVKAYKEHIEIYDSSILKEGLKRIHKELGDMLDANL